MNRLIYGLLAICFVMTISCTTNEEEVSLPEPESIASQTFLSNCHWQTICTIFPQKGWRPLPFMDCSPNQNPWNCYLLTEVCLPYYKHCFFPVKDWWWNVWEVASIAEQHDLFSIFEVLEIDPEENRAAVFPVSDHIAGFQYTALQPEMRRDGNLFVNTVLEIDEATSRRLGLDNSIIPAGSYPVVHDRTHNTYNAFVKITSYPFALESRVAYAQYDWKDEYIHEILEQLNPRAARNSRIMQDERGYKVVDPDNQVGVHLFSTNGQSFAMSVKGAGVSPFYPLKIDGPIRLDENIARSIGIESFELQPNLMSQTLDRETGAVTVVFYKP